MIGLVPLFFSNIPPLKRVPLMTIEMVPVVPPDHLLGMIEGPIGAFYLHRHVRLVLTDRSDVTAGRDYGVLSGQTWNLADLDAKQSMLVAGFGMSDMPVCLVAGDIVYGRLIVFRSANFDSGTARLVMSGTYLADLRPGLAGE